MVSFFRAKIMVELVVRHVIQPGFPGVAEMIAGITVPSIAEWRWGTLSQAMGLIQLVPSTLRHHWDQSIFKNTKDPVKLKKVGASLISPNWSLQLDFIYWLATWLCKLQGWGKGCRARELAATTDSPSSYDHMLNGGRLPEAEDLVNKHLEAGLVECNS